MRRWGLREVSLRSELTVQGSSSLSAEKRKASIPLPARWDLVSTCAPNESIGTTWSSVADQKRTLTKGTARKAG